MKLFRKSRSPSKVSFFLVLAMLFALLLPATAFADYWGVIIYYPNNHLEQAEPFDSYEAAEAFGKSLSRIEGYEVYQVEEPTDPPVTPPTDPPNVPPVKPTDPPVNPPTDPPNVPPVKPTDPPVTPPADPPVTPPADPPVNPPADPPSTPPADPPSSPPADPPGNPPFETLPKETGDDEDDLWTPPKVPPEKDFTEPEYPYGFEFFDVEIPSDPGDPPDDCAANPWHPNCFLEVTEVTEIPKINEGKLTAPKPAKSNKTPSKDFMKKYNWDGQFDVIVYGLDIAGATAAISAAQAGASVLVIDKAPAKEIGGYTVDGSQEMIYTEKETDMVKFLESLQGGYDHLDEEIWKTLASGAYDLPNWLKQHGANKMYRYDPADLEYKELEGSDNSFMFRLGQKNAFDKSIWRLLLRNIQALQNKRIYLLFESQINELIQEPDSKMIVGVKLKKGGKDYLFRANRGVILSSEGFENNETMIENYLQIPTAIPRYTKWNDGDGIKLAMDAGADLWHMGNVMGYELHATQYGDAKHLKVPLQGNLYGNQLGTRSCFVVGENGRRFTNEAGKLRSGHRNAVGDWKSQFIPDKAWAIFDEEGLKKLKLYQNWSDENAKEIEDGIIIKKDSIKELAEQIKVPADVLEQQFADYNKYCQDGYDPQHGRAADALHALSDAGPYFALEMSPVVTATLGGPWRNAGAEVLDTKGKPIPHLYSCGSIGSVLPDIFPRGLDLTEALVFGQVSGINAAADKGDTPPSHK